MDIQTLK